MLKDFFVQTTSQKVLSFLSLRAGQSFHERQLARKAAIGTGSANRALNALFKAGFLKREQRGRMFFYCLADEEPAIMQFKILNMILNLKPLTARLQSHAKTIILYGSSSQGTDDYQSDVDILAVTSERESVREIVENFRFPREIKVTIKSPSEWRDLESKDAFFYGEILRGRVLWEQPIDESKL